MNPRAVEPLLQLPPERKAAELAQANAVEQQQRAWQRQGRLMAIPWTLVSIAGLVIAWSSLHVYGDNAQILFWGGTLIGNAAILGYCFMLWRRELA